MKLFQFTVNDPIIIVLYRNEFCETYILSNGHETCQSYNDQIIMKLYVHVYTLMVLNFFVWIFTCMLSRQTLKLGYLDTTYVFSGEVETCHVTALIQSLWKFCQNNLFWNFVK